MRHTMIFAKSAALFLLLVLCISAPSARAQNQTPANVASIGWADPTTGLTWTKADNGSAVDWDQANAYCSNLRLGGYSDWRLPAIDELQGIYDPSIDVSGQYADGTPAIRHVKGSLKLTGGIWSSTQKNANARPKPVPEAWYITFDDGSRYGSPLRGGGGIHALCVRR
jgi:hypothetical protein